MTAATVDTELFGTSGGLKDEFEFEITESSFVFDDNYNNGDTLLLQWKGPDEDGEETPLVIPVGSGWDQGDRSGSFAEHETREKFHPSSFYGMLIDWIAGPSKKRKKGFDGVLDHFAAAGFKAVDARQADIWVGTRWKCERQAFEFGKDEDGDPITSERVMPVEYLGSSVVDGSGGKKKSKASKNSKNSKNSKSAKSDKIKAKSKKKAEVDDDDDDDESESAVDPKIMKKLAKLAARYPDDHDEWMAAALEIDGVDDDDELMDRITDPDDLYAELTE